MIEYMNKGYFLNNYNDNCHDLVDSARDYSVTHPVLGKVYLVGAVAGICVASLPYAVLSAIEHVAKAIFSTLMTIPNREYAQHILPNLLYTALSLCLPLATIGVFGYRGNAVTVGCLWNSARA